MAGKNKKKEGKGKKSGDEGKLPPPNLDREGAVEALLTFQIHGKEEAVCLCEEEADGFKDKNYQQEARNYQLKQQQVSHYKVLVKEAHKLQNGIDSVEKVEQEKIESVLKETLDLRRRGLSDVEELKSRIKAVDLELHTLNEEIKKWTNYKDNIRGKRSEYITEMHTDMDSFGYKERHLQEKLSYVYKIMVPLRALKKAFSLANYADELTKTLQRVKWEVDRKVLKVQASQTKKGTEFIMSNLDKDTKSEFMDNIWLGKQIDHMRRVLESLRKETDALERKNIQFIRTVSEAQSRDIQATSDLYSMSTGGGLRVGDELPSLVDVAKCTSDKGVGGQAGRFEMQLLSLHGSRPPFHVIPDTVHLPPIEKQRRSHTAQPPTTKWPISNAMLSSVLGVE